MEKTCAKCLVFKGLIDFSKRSAAVDGLRNQCKKCDAEYRAKVYADNPEKARARSREWNVGNLDRHSQRLKEWRAKNPDKIRTARKIWEAKNPGRVAALSKQWYAANRAKVAAHNAAYYAQNTEYFADANKRWRKENPEAARAITRKAKAARKGAEGSFSAEDIKRLLTVQRGRCCYCRKEFLGNYHIDHIMPASKGGSNYPSNLQLLCPACNQSKKDKLPEDFARRMGYLI